MARLERIFLKVGLALLAMWGGATLHGIVFSRVAVAEFYANQATKGGSSSPVQRTSSSEARAF